MPHSLENVYTKYFPLHRNGSIFHELYDRLCIFTMAQEEKEVFFWENNTKILYIIQFTRHILQHVGQKTVYLYTILIYYDIYLQTIHLSFG